MTSTDLETNSLTISDPVVAPYNQPVEQLLSYGDAFIKGEWPDYLALGLTAPDIPELIRMATDPMLLENEELQDDAPIHAWRALGQLRAQEAIEPLFALLKLEENDWAFEELPKVYRLIGPTAIPTLKDFLKNPENGWTRCSAGTALELIGKDFPEHRLACIGAIVEALQLHSENEPDFNAILIGDLVELKAVEAAPLIQEAYEADHVDESYCGFWLDVGLELGVVTMTEEERQAWEEESKKKQRERLPFNFGFPSSPSELYSVYSERQAAQNKQIQTQKNKQKRKADKSARLRNRR
jgi:hypothetical protein